MITAADETALLFADSAFEELSVEATPFAPPPPQDTRSPIIATAIKYFRTLILQFS
jgi:hypothetical protein